MSAVRHVTSTAAGITVASGAATAFPAATIGLKSDSPVMLTASAIPFRTAGTITNLTARKLAGSRSSMTLTLRKAGNAINGAIAFTSTNGEYEDTTGSDSITPGDALHLQVAGGSGGATSLTANYLGFLWAATGTTTTHLACAQLSYATAGETSYRQPGSAAAKTTVQAEGEWLVKLPTGADHVTIKNLFVGVNTNTSTNTIAVSVNGATGPGTAPTITIAANSGAHQYEDTTNSIQAKDGDKLSIKVVTGASTVNPVIDVIAIEVQSDDGVSFLIAANPAGVSLGTTASELLGGDLSTTTTEANAQAKFGIAGTLSLLSAYVKTHGTTSKIDLRKAAASIGSPGNLSVSTAGASGAWVTDTANSYTTTAADELNYSTAFGSAAATVTCIAITVQVTTPVSATAVFIFESAKKLAIASASTPLESTKTILQTGQAPAESTKELAQTVAGPLSALKKLAATVLEPLEASTTASGIAQTAAVVIDALKAIIKTSAVPGESLQPVSRQAGNPAETAQAVTKATLEPAEATQKRAQTTAAPGEAGKTVTAALADPVEAAKRIAATEPTTVEALSIVEATAAAAPAETGQTVASSEQTPLEAGEGVAGTTTADVDAAQALAVAAAAPAETTATVVATGDASPLETLTTAAATADAPLSALQRLQQTAAAPLEALGPVLTSISQTATVVVDALERLTLRATAPLEPGSRVSRTVALWIDGRRRRRRSEAVLTGKDGMISADSSSNEADTSAGGIS